MTFYESLSKFSQKKRGHHLPHHFHEESYPELCQSQKDYPGHTGGYDQQFNKTPFSENRG